MASASSVTMDTSDEKELKPEDWGGRDYKDVMATRRSLNIIYMVLMNRAHENKKGCQLVAKGPEIGKLWEDFCKWYGACFVGNGVSTVTRNKFSEVNNELLKTRLNQSYADAKHLYVEKESKYSSDAVREKRDPDRFLYFLVYEGNRKDTLYVTLNVNDYKWTVKRVFANPASDDLKNANIPVENLIPLQINAFPESTVEPKNYNWLSDKNPDQLYQEIEKCFKLYFCINAEQLVANLHESTNRNNILWQQPYFRDLYYHFVGNDEKTQKLQSLVTAKDQEIQNLSDRVQTLTANLDQVDRQLNETWSAASAQLQQMNVAGLRVLEQINLQQQEIEDQKDWKKRATTYGQQLEAATNALSERFQQLEKQNAVQKSTLDAKDQEIADLKERDRAANEKQTQLQKALREAKDDVKKVLEIADKQENELSEREKDIDTLLQQLDSKDQKAASDVVNMKRIFDAVMEKAKTFRGQIEGLTREKTRLEDELARTHEQLQRCIKENQELLTRMNEQISELTGQLEACRREKQELADKHAKDLEDRERKCQELLQKQKGNGDKEAKRGGTNFLTATPGAGTVAFHGRTGNDCKEECEKNPDDKRKDGDAATILAEKNAKIAALERQLAEIQQIQRQAEEQKDSIKDLQTQLLEAQKATRRAEERAAQEQRKHTQALELSKAEITRLLQQVQQEADTHAAELVQLRQETVEKIEKKTQELQGVQEQLAAKHKDLENRQKKYDEKIAGYENFVSHASELLGVIWKKAFPGLGAPNMKTAEDIRNVQRQIEQQGPVELKQAADQAKKLVATIQQLQNNVDAAARDVNNQREWTADVEQSQRIHETLLAGLREEQSKYEQKQKTLAELQTTTQAFNDLLATAYKEQQTLNKNLSADLVKKQQTIHELKVQITRQNEEYERQLQNINTELAKKNEELQSRQQLVDNVSLRITSAQTVIQSKDQELDRIREQLRALNSELDQNKKEQNAAMVTIYNSLNHGRAPVASVKQEELADLIKQKNMEEKGAAEAVQQLLAEHSDLLQKLQNLQANEQKLERTRQLVLSNDTAIQKQTKQQTKLIQNLQKEQAALVTQKRSAANSLQLVLQTQTSIQTCFLEQLNNNLRLLDDLKQQNAERTRETADLRTTLLEKESQLDRSNEVAKTQASIVQRQREELQNLQSEKNNLDQQLANHRKLLNDTIQRRSTMLPFSLSLTDDFDTTMRSLDEVLNKFNNEKIEMKAENDTLQRTQTQQADRIAQQNKQLNELQKALSDQKMTLDSQTIELVLLKTKMSSLIPSSTPVSVDQTTTDFLQKFDTIWAQYTTLYNNNLSGLHAQLQERTQQLQQAYQTTAEQTRQIQQLVNQNTEQRAEFERLQQEERSKYALTAQISSQQNALDASKASSVPAQAELVSIEAEKTNLKNKQNSLLRQQDLMLDILLTAIKSLLFYPSDEPSPRRRKLYEVEEKKGMDTRVESRKRSRSEMEPEGQARNAFQGQLVLVQLLVGQIQTYRAGCLDENDIFDHDFAVRNMVDGTVYQVHYGRTVDQKDLLSPKNYPWDWVGHCWLMQAPNRTEWDASKKKERGKNREAQIENQQLFSAHIRVLIRRIYIHELVNQNAHAILEISEFYARNFSIPTDGKDRTAEDDTLRSILQSYGYREALEITSPTIENIRFLWKNGIQLFAHEKIFLLAAIFRLPGHGTDDVFKPSDMQLIVYKGSPTDEKADERRMVPMQTGAGVVSPSAPGTGATWRQRGTPINAAEPSRQYAPTWSQAIEMGLHGDSDVGVAFSPEEIARAILDPESLRQNAHRRLVAVSKDSNILEKQPHLTPLEYKTYKSQLDFIEGLTPEATRSRLSGFETELWLYTLQESSPVSVVDLERTLATGRLVVVEGKLTQTYTSGLQVNVRTQALRPVLASLPAWLYDLYHPENHVLPLAALRPRSLV